MSTIKINELATSSISLSDFFAKADANGLATKNTIQGLANILDVASSSLFRGSLASGDATASLDGWYFAEDTGTYTNNGGLIIDTSDNIVIIIVADTQTTFSKVDIPITSPTLATTFDAANNTDASTMKASSDYYQPQIDNISKIETSFPFDASYSSGSVTTFNLTTTESVSAGVVKRIKLNAAVEGYIKFAFFRDLTGNKFKVIKYFDFKVNAGVNELDVNLKIDEDFHFGVLSGSAQIYTASGDVGASVDLLYFNGAFTDTSVWTSTSGRSHNIEIDVERGEVYDEQVIETGLSICYCGDSITDFCDSLASNGVQYVGYDAHIARSIKFKEQTILGYSGIQLAQSGGFANTKVSSLVNADVYPIYLGTNDFALTTQSTIGVLTDFFNDTGVNTFYGAMRVLFDGIYAKNENAIIILITPNHRNYSGLNSWTDTNSNGDTLNDFSNAIREIGNYTGVPIVDLMSDCKINYSTLSDLTYDNLHPNTKGYQEIANTFISKMYNYFNNL